METPNQGSPSAGQGACATPGSDVPTPGWVRQLWPPAPVQASPERDAQLEDVFQCSSVLIRDGSPDPPKQLAAPADEGGATAWPGIGVLGSGSSWTEAPSATAPPLPPLLAARQALGGAAGSGGSGSPLKPSISPTKSGADAAAFHLEVHAGETEAAAAGPAADPAWGQPPSRNVALRSRHSRQLRQSTYDQYGAPISSTARPFGLWSAPYKIGESCTGLGVYFASLKSFILAALLLCIIAAYPLASNLQNQRWSDHYALGLQGGSASSGPTCAKQWWVSSWLTGTTPGGRCSSSLFSSSYDCPAACGWSPERLDSLPQCAGVPLPPLPAGTPHGAANASCLLHLPCNRLSTDPAAADGPCYCCELELSGASYPSSSVPPGQLWVLLVGQLGFLVWVLFHAHTQLKAAYACDARAITASDYSVVLGGVKAETTDEELRQWSSHYGAVVSAINITSVGGSLKVGRQLQDLLTRQAESQAWDAAADSNCNPFGWLYRLLALGSFRSGPLGRRVARKEQLLRCYERQELQPTGAALVVFSYGEHAGNCLEDHHRPAIRRLADAILCGCTANAPKLKDTHVRVKRAPFPTDIIWEHTTCTGARAVARRLWSVLLTGLIIAAGAAIQYGLSVAAEQERQQRINYLHLSGSQPDSVDFSSWHAFYTSAFHVTKLRAIAAVAGLSVVVLNWAVTFAVRRLTVWERWHTRTSSERYAGIKLALSYLLNSFAVPLLAAYLSGNTHSWYSRGGLMESAFFMQAANAVLPPLATLIRPKDLLCCHVASRWARTQPMMNRLLLPPEFPLAEQYASALTTLGVALWWMPVLPISPVLAVAGLSFAYWADKVDALRRAARPANMRGKAAGGGSGLLMQLLPLVQLLLMRFLYFKSQEAMAAVFWTGLALCLLFALAPIRALLGLVPRRRSTATGGLSYYETLAGGKRGGCDDAYLPQVPAPCSTAFRQRVADLFSVPDVATPASKEPLPRQRAGTGGRAARPPYHPAASRTAMAAAPPVAAAAAKGSRGGTPREGLAGRAAALGESVAAGLAQGANLLWNPEESDDVFDYDWQEEGGKGEPGTAVPHDV